MYIFSVYVPPRLSNAQFEALLYRLEREAASKRPVVIAGDFNAWSTVWGSRLNTATGDMLLECMASLDMCLLNTGTEPKLVRGDKMSIIDLTFASSDVAARVSEWKLLDDHTESDHRAILLTLLDEKRKKAPAPPWKWNIKSFDQDTFEVAIADDRSIAGPAAEKAKKLMGLVSHACDASMARSTPRKARSPVYWWNDDIARLREGCISARRTAQRARVDRAHHYERYKEARAELLRAIKNSKRQCWKDLVQSIDDCPWGRPYKIVMNKLQNQAAPSPTDLPLVTQIVRTLFPSDAIGASLLSIEGRENPQHVPPVTMEKLR
uniref:Endonuclease/exonuclease/phosphatase domain-containing protein n=1 Tax=Trichogramma kaykai TaxID=54128 RepID=A0ABD2W3M3_9HYME